MITPAQIESRLLQLSKEIDEAQKDLSDVEVKYAQAKTAFELAVAASRLSRAGDKLTVQQKEDEALIENADKFQNVEILEATVRAMRGNVARIKIQVEIARSVGTSVRSSWEAS